MTRVTRSKQSTIRGGRGSNMQDLTLFLTIFHKTYSTISNACTGDVRKQSIKMPQKQ